MHNLIYFVCFLLFIEYAMDIYKVVKGKEYSSDYYKSISDRISAMSNQSYSNFRFLIIFQAIVILSIVIYVAISI